MSRIWINIGPYVYPHRTFFNDENMEKETRNIKCLQLLGQFF